MTDVKRHGLAYFEGVPPNGEGLEEVMHQIGVLKQEKVKRELKEKTYYWY